MFFLLSCSYSKSTVLSNPMLGSFHVVMFTLDLLTAVTHSSGKEFNIWKSIWNSIKNTTQGTIDFWDFWALSLLWDRARPQRCFRNSLSSWHYKPVLYSFFPETQKQMLNRRSKIMFSMPKKKKLQIHLQAFLCSLELGV